MLKTPFYDPTKSYEENYKNGPYGSFKDGKIVAQKGFPQEDFLGEKVYLPFGIPAGPIINSNFAKAAFEKGFDIVVYKTVRSDFFPCHPFPNILSVQLDGDLTLEKMKHPVLGDTRYEEPLSITNSFGVPSRKVEVWQEDVKKAISYAGKGQILVLSFMGTVKPNQTKEELIADHVMAAQRALETGAKILEVNLACPNIGNEGLICYDLDLTQKVCKAIRNVIGNTPLSLKVGYYPREKDIERLAEIANEYANSIAGINSLQAPVVDGSGNQALPGEKFRLLSGICGNGIKWAGMDFVKKMKTIKEKNKYTFSIEAVGGVTVPEDYFEYKDAGADSVMSATGAMWNPELAVQIKKQLNLI